MRWCIHHSSQLHFLNHWCCFTIELIHFLYLDTLVQQAYFLGLPQPSLQPNSPITIHRPERGFCTTRGLPISPKQGSLGFLLNPAQSVSSFLYEYTVASLHSLSGTIGTVTCLSFADSGPVGSPSRMGLVDPQPATVPYCNGFSKILSLLRFGTHTFGNETI